MKKIINLSYLCILSILVACGSGGNESELTKKSNKESSVFEKAETTFSNNGDDVNANLVSEDISIKLTPFVPNYEGVGESGCRLLKDRLNSAITKVGFGGEGSNPRFIVGPSVNILTSDLTATAPPKYACTYEINFMVVDVQTETVFNSYKSEFKGVGDSEEKAFISGARNLNFINQGFMKFLKESEQKIFKYFESNCSKIVAEAESEAKMRNYDMAFSLVNSIPSEADSCFMIVQDKKLEFFNLSLNSSCADILNKMRAELGKFNDPSASGFNSEAMDYYSMIDSKSDCYADAQKEYKAYLSKLNPKAKRDWQQKMQVYKDTIALIKFREEAKMEQTKMAYEFQTKMKEVEAKMEIEGNRRLLAKYKHDESPWLIRLFSSGSKLFKGEMSTSN
jgi:hypothetical protein